MFSKLKSRLTILNLVVAGIILLAISAVAFTLISANIAKNSEQMLDVVVNNLAIQQKYSGEFDPGVVLKAPSGIFPYIIIGIDNSGRVVSSAMPTDEKAMDKKSPKAVLTKDQVSKVVQDVQVWEAEAKSLKQRFDKGIPEMYMPESIISLGEGRSYRFRTINARDTASGGILFVILQDMSSEKALLANVGFTLGACVLGGLLLMALGGLYLAERSIRPVKAAWQKQRDFVADASHELRTPLAAIIGNIDVVMDDPKAQVEEKQVFCQGIYEEAGRMSVLVDGLLMLARADSDTLVFEKGPVEIAELVRSAVTFIRPMAEKKNIQMDLKIVNAPVMEGDGSRLRQVVLQLLDNAMKYTPRDGRVDISVESIRDTIEIKVTDNGIGIAAEHREKIFERFFRIDPSRDRKVDGHGLGLAIAKHIVEYHGGTISVTSEIGKGSTFTVILPEMVIQ